MFITMSRLRKRISVAALPVGSETHQRRGASVLRMLLFSAILAAMPAAAGCSTSSPFRDPSSEPAPPNTVSDWLKAPKPEADR